MRCGEAPECRWDATFRHCEDKVDFVPLPCGDHFDEGSCKGSAGCKWYPQAFLCARVGEPVDCMRFFTPNGCDAHVCNAECVGVRFHFLLIILLYD
jgi:hypothetical protein